MTRQIQTPGSAPDADATRDQLRAKLDALGIPYTTRDTKAELQAKLDTAQSSIDPDVLAADLATDLETNYPELVQKLNARINALEAENADLRAKVAKHEAPTAIAAPSKAPAPQLTGMRLTDEGYVVG